MGSSAMSWTRRLPPPLLLHPTQPIKRERERERERERSKTVGNDFVVVVVVVRVLTLFLSC